MGILELSSPGSWTVERPCMEPDQSSVSLLSSELSVSCLERGMGISGIREGNGGDQKYL